MPLVRVACRTRAAHCLACTARLYSVLLLRWNVIDTFIGVLLTLTPPIIHNSWLSAIVCGSGAASASCSALLP